MAIPTTLNFIDNKYTKWYFNIIESASLKNRSKKNDYFEKHHIQPKSIFGEGKTVLLTAREHFVCHLLLPKMLTGKAKIKMSLALHKLLHGNKQEYCKSSRLYEIIKKEHKIACSNRSLEYWTEENKNIRSEKYKGENNPNYGNKMSEESKKKISKLNKGKLAKENHPLFGIGHTEESKLKMSKNARRASAGKKWYHNPITKQQKYFIKNHQPEGWLLGRG